jgi:ACS family D-galactonate transporter-like MFS transporter
VRVNGTKVPQAEMALRSISTIPAADLAFVSANAIKVAKAQKDNPSQWQKWWWICFIGQIVLIPCVFLLTGHWGRGRAREQEQEHERVVQRELARLHESQLAGV